MTFIPLLAALLVFSLGPAPLLAQVATSTATSTVTTTPATPAQSSSGSGSSGDSNALGLGLGIGAGVLALGALSSLGASAPVAVSNRLLFKSFGGRIVAVIPCVSGLGPSFHITIKPAGVFAPTYIWTPATITKLFGPPRNIGQQVLGTADIPFVCFIPAKVPIPLYGLRMFTVGTSALF